MDTIANMLTTILNGQRVRKDRVAVPYSTFKESLARMLHERSLLGAVRVQEGATPKLILTLAYEGTQPKIAQLKRVSRPGIRSYVSSDDLPYRGGRPGFYVVSTSQGLLDENEARKAGVGGELICDVQSV